MFVLVCFLTTAGFARYLNSGPCLQLLTGHARGILGKLPWRALLSFPSQSLWLLAASFPSPAHYTCTDNRTVFSSSRRWQSESFLALEYSFELQIFFATTKS